MPFSKEALAEYLTRTNQDYAKIASRIANTLPESIRGIAEPRLAPVLQDIETGKRAPTEEIIRMLDALARQDGIEDIHFNGNEASLEVVSGQDEERCDGMNYASQRARRRMQMTLEAIARSTNNMYDNSPVLGLYEKDPDGREYCDRCRNLDMEKPVHITVLVLAEFLMARCFPSEQQSYRFVLREQYRKEHPLVVVDGIYTPRRLIAFLVYNTDVKSFLQDKTKSGLFERDISERDERHHNLDYFYFDKDFMSAFLTEFFEAADAGKLYHKARRTELTAYEDDDLSPEEIKYIKCKARKAMRRRAKLLLKKARGE